METPEQLAAVRSRSDFLRINAFAGTGKTTMLVSYATARPNERQLYIAFNKSIQLEATRKFPSNVKCITSHGLAYARHGSEYNDAGKIVDKVRINDAIDALDLRQYPDQFAMYVADVSLKVLNRYLCGDSSTLTERLTNGLIIPDMGASDSDIVFCAQRLWDKMKDVSDTSIGMVHDGYLKLYQLSDPQLKYDRILFDEAQDANGVTAAIVDSQPCGKVIVGDSHQAIYSFRGAVNAMQMFDAQETLYLTKSFRFGQRIADVANVLLGTYKGEKKKIVGTDEPGSIGPLDTSKPFTVIARSNATLFDEAISLMSQGKRLHFVGGIQGYRMNDLMDTYSLFTGHVDRIKSPHLKAFKNFDAAEDYAKLSDDKELKSLIGVVKRHNSRLPGLIHKIKAADVVNPNNANVCLTTAHKSKGLEWQQVKLADDFMTLLDQNKKPRRIEFLEHEDVNILYVAATRARQRLHAFPELNDLLDLKTNRATAHAGVKKMSSADHHKSATSVMSGIPAPAGNSRESKLPEWARPLPNGSVRR